MAERRIWTPREGAGPRAQPSNANSTRAAVTLGFGQLSGEGTSVAKLVTLISQSSFPKVVRAVAYLINTLDSGIAVDPGLQSNLAAQFIDATLAVQLHRTDWRGFPIPPVLFHRRQQLFILKMALLSCSIPDEVSWNDEARHAYGKACLMANDILDHPVNIPRAEQHELRDIVQILPYQAFGRPLHARAAFARAQRLWIHCQSQKSPIQRKDRVNLDDVFKELYGITLTDFVTVVIGILSNCSRFDPHDEDPLKRLTINRSTFLKATSFPQSTFETALDIVTATQQSLSMALLHRPRQSEVWDFSLFQRFPLINYAEGISICYDRTFLLKMLTEGTYWLIYDGLADNRRNDFEALFGEVFESYIAEIFQRIYPASTTIRPSFHAGLRFSGEPAEVSDGLMDLDDVLVLTEVKGSLLTAYAKYAGDPEALERDLIKKFANPRLGAKKGVAQLAASIAKLGQGKRPGRLPQFDLSRFKMVIPVLVAYDEAVTSVGIRRYLDGQFKKALSAEGNTFDRIGRLTVLDARDVECLESLSKRQSVRDVLLEYQHLGETPPPFFDFLFARYRQDLDLPNTLMWEASEEALASAIRRLFPHGS